MAETIPLISSRGELSAALEQPCEEAGLVVTTIGDEIQAAEHLSVEMPELAIIDFSDERIDSFALLGDIMSDPWLLQGGIIAVHRKPEQARRLTEMQGANIVIVLREAEIPHYLAQVLRIVRNNRRLIFQRGMGMDFIGNISASFQLENDPVVARCYANLVCNFLYSAGRIDAQGKSGAQLALIEMLMNAMEHGNCGISAQAKQAWLEEGRSIGELIAREGALPANRDKRVTFEYSLREDHAEILIRDEGAGFDWRHLPDPVADDNLLALRGRGIMMSRAAVDKLRYNETGNEVRFEIRFSQTERQAPVLFRDLAVHEVQAGDVVFQQGEEGDVLYYIARGNYEVSVDGRAVSTLTPDDIFIGEMSFLLNNRRSATVTALDSGKLIMISRQEFVEGIRVNPHYALLLSRLLAQRIARLNLMSSGMF